ncbi:hypothetical protein MTR67_003307 [Solanum verrucosum]|uniref:Uncharacterized protein n=1 Tax=Solanum verrucosum TaxID=315347 RepID=A0AAF0T6R6_SOLVR|nr:hypothetical protein MTR67_003307 [Solanum verrucosum]
MVHMYRNGFKPRYFEWIDHGESDGLDGRFYNSIPVDVNNMVALHGQIRVEHDRVHEMINDAFGVQGGMEPEQYFDETPNEEERHFYDQLEESSRPLCEGSPHSALSVAAKRLVSKLGLTYDRIHCCVNGCMLFYKTNSELENCKFCGHARYKRTPTGKMVPVKAMHYLPLIPRLKRLYASMSYAPHMRWHREYRRPSGVLSHPFDGETWKHFDNVYPDFASEPRNVRLGLCSDGCTPFSNNASPYSCWPNFVMHASLMWTINDFPAYGMLSGWMTVGKLACPYCMENSKAFTLKNGRKNTWFDCHRQFLPMDHEFRKMKNAFRKNKVESDPPTPLLTGHQIWERVSQLPKVIEASPPRLPGYGVEHNWTKQSIFWELPYWKDNLLRHNLDVMHIEKNYFGNLFNTVMDVKVKPKANFSFTLDEKHEIIEWFKNLRMPEGYALNLERGNRPNRNDEGGIDSLFPPISIFNQNGRGSKKRGKRGFTDMEMQSVVTHILLNCLEIQSYVNLFVNTWGNEAIYTEFSKWMRNYVDDEYSSVQHLQLVKEVALGPESQVLTMNNYCVNGFKFRTEEVSRNKKTNNRGVYIQGYVDGTGQTIEYYGVIQEIIEVRYSGWPKKKNVLFRYVAYQNDVAIVQQQVDVELETTLQHPQHILQEVSDDEILNVKEEIFENEENESFDDVEWYDNENETTEKEEWENDGIETNEEE